MTTSTPSVMDMNAEDRAVFFDEITEWWKTAEELAKLNMKEKKLRQTLADKGFQTPKEGTNKLDLGVNGRFLQLDYKITRKVDETALDALIKSQTVAADLMAKIIRYKAECSVTEWKKATADERKLFGDVITEKPGMPSLEIVTPKR